MSRINADTQLERWIDQYQNLIYSICFKLTNDYFDAQDPDALLLVETWTEPSLQEAHCRTEVFAALQTLKAQFCTDVTIDKFNG